MQTAARDILDSVIEQADLNEKRAYAILGARPGPGVDLLINPVEPLNGEWFVTGMTKAGYAFINKFWRWQPLNNQKLAEMKKQARHWELSVETRYPFLPL